MASTLVQSRPNGNDGLPSLDVDAFSDAFLADPFPTHAMLRDAGAVVWLPRYGIWSVARHAEVSAALNDWSRFRSGSGVGLANFARETPWRTPSLVLERDPPEHTRARAVLQRILSPAAMKRLRATFMAAAETLVGEVLARGTIDAVPDLAEAFPLSVFPDALGIGREGREHILPFANVVFNAFGPDNHLRRSALAEAAPHIAWVAEQCERATTSGFGAEIHEAAKTGAIAQDEAPLLIRSLFSAGVDTTVNGLAAALHCLARSPAQWAALRADPSLARAAFEEAVRLESPVQTFFRTTVSDVEFAGTTIPAQSKLLMFLGAANRDPRRWDAPDDYVITRQTTGHVGFGAGIHMCVGQLIARLEGECLLAVLARAVETIEPAGPPVRRLNNTLRGLKSLPVRLTPARNATR